MFLDAAGQPTSSRQNALKSTLPRNPRRDKVFHGLLTGCSQPADRCGGSSGGRNCIDSDDCADGRCNRPPPSSLGSTHRRLRSFGELPAEPPEGTLPLLPPNREETGAGLSQGNNPAVAMFLDVELFFSGKPSQGLHG